MKNVLIFILLLSSFHTYSQGILEGFVKEKSNSKPIAGAQISVGKHGTVSNSEGKFLLKELKPDSYKISVQAIGFIKKELSVEIQENKTSFVEIQLEEDNLLLEEISISASRTETKINKIPGRIELVSPLKIQLLGSQTTDELLLTVPGVNVSRSFGLFSHKATVTMRGVSGNEQARVLVLADGIPVNKADGGSVNWNLLSTGEVERIEVIKGPGSALYGGNAMGGIINIVSKKPVKPLEGSVNTSYGTYNTQSYKAKLGGTFTNGFYWNASGLFRKSDGYITQSVADQKMNPYIVNSTFNEKAVTFKSGYSKTKKFAADIEFTLYDDMRETGEKVFQPHGNTTDHDTYSLRAAFKGSVNNFSWNTSIFFQKEFYKRVSEWFKDDYTWYDVLSLRTDYGLLSGINYKLNNHSFSGGIDLRAGSVDASDIYYTSTDQVDNRGNIRFLGAYLQDEWQLFNEKWKLLSGIRYDLSSFSNGAFIIHSPSAETSFMKSYIFENEDAKVWGAFSPRIALQFNPSNSLRFYTGYSRGFRPSVLDDLCRSGRVRGGFKVANSNLNPEYLNNIELGTDYKPVSWLKISGAAYYSLGTDFMYYVSTGDSIDMGFGLRPIMIRSNISKVRIYGFESDANASVFRNLSVFGAYAFNISKIADYKPLDGTDLNNLTGKFLTDVPVHSFSAGALFRSKIVNVGLSARYTGKMYVNDQNIYDELVGSNQYPATFTCDIKLQRDFFRYFNASLSIQNVFNEIIYESKGARGPGRFIMFDLGIKF